MANKVFSTKSWATFTNKFKAMIASLRGMSDTLDTKASVIDPISVSAIASGSSSVDWSSCTELVNYIREHQSAPSMLVVNASTTVYTLMLTGSEWSAGSGSGTFAYKGLGINGTNGKPRIIELLLETADSSIVADILNNTEVALQAAVTSLQSTVSSLQSVVGAHSTAIEGQERQIYEALNAASAASDTASNAQTTANSALSKANTNATTITSLQTTADSALSKANTNAGNITSLTSAIDAVSNRSFQNNANFAPAFVTTKSYKVGEYVTYDSKLYRCTTAHTAGAWVAGHFTKVTVGEDMYVPFTVINTKITGNASSASARTPMALSTSLILPAGIYFVKTRLVAVDFSFLTADTTSFYLDLVSSPFNAFGTTYAQPWFKTGGEMLEGGIIHIPRQLSFAGGTQVGYLMNVNLQAGEMCQFDFFLTFTRLSTH